MLQRGWRAPSIWFNIGAQTSASIAVWIAVASNIIHQSLAISKGGKKGHTDKTVDPGGTSLGQSTLVLILAPVDGDTATIVCTDNKS